MYLYECGRCGEVSSEARGSLWTRQCSQTNTPALRMRQVSHTSRSLVVKDYYCNVWYRVRTATVQVISALLQEGADPNAKMNISLANGNTVLVTPLHLVLQAGAHASNPQVEHAEAGTFGDDSVLNSSVVSVASGHGTGAPSRMRSSGAKCWVKAAHTLVVAGNNNSQLHSPLTGGYSDY